MGFKSSAWDPEWMRAFWMWTLATGALLGVAIYLTAGTALGVPLSHYNLSLAVIAVSVAVGWRALKKRRVASVLLLYSAILATVSGFLLLYLKDGLKTAELKDWMKWWHSVTSIALLALFLVHWLLNHARLNEFTKRLLTRERAYGIPVLGAWFGVALAGVLTWGAQGRALFTDGNYLYLSSWAILVGVGFTYGLWLVFRWPAMRARLAEATTRNRARALVDTSLWLAHWLALLTGFALLYFKDFLHGNGYKYVSKWWHTSTSVAFVALVVLHIGFNARLVAAHARRLDGDLGRARPAEAAEPAAEPGMR